MNKSRLNVAVVGCGAIGITSALAIQRRLGGKADVTIFGKDVSPHTTSDIAAGLWEPFLVGDTPVESIIKWSKVTYEYLLELWKKGKAEQAGILLQPVTYLTDSVSYVKPDWLKLSLGHTELPKEKVIRIGERLGQKLTGGFHFISFIWEASIFIPFLTEQFLSNGGNLIRRHIYDLSELDDYDIVVNCTGLEAKDLVGDRNLKPLRGQVTRVKAPWVKEVVIVDSKETCYVIPNINFVILGGTKQEHYNCDVDETDKNYIMRNPTRNCSVLMPSIKSSKIIKHQVGLRPGRDKVRLEAEIGGNRKNGPKIVHNYGHGGAGITLSVGCAQETAELVERLCYSQKSKL